MPRSPAAPWQRRPQERGSAVLVVLVLAILMAAMVVENALALHDLKREIQLIEKRQDRQHARRLGKAGKLTTENTGHTEPKPAVLPVAGPGRPRGRRPTNKRSHLPPQPLAGTVLLPCVPCLPWSRS